MRRKTPPKKAGDNSSGQQSTSTPINARSLRPQFAIRSDDSNISGYLSDENEEESSTPDSSNSLHSTQSGRIQKKTANQKPKPVEREIKKLQNTTHNLFKLAPFTRLVKETITKMSGGKSFRVQGEAVQALMEACQAALITLFEASYMCTNHRKRVTLTVQDMQLVRRILYTFGDRMF